MEVTELHSPPSLAALYARAAAGVLPLGRPEALPERRLALRAQEIDTEHVADYARVCGYALGASLPPTYPHLLGFPLELELMSARSFPFGVLGVVHVANRIEQLEPVPAGARPDVIVWAERLRPHRRGRQFDLVTELELGGGVVWREHSTYLRPGGGSDDAAVPGPKRDREPPPTEGMLAAEWRIPGDIGRRYAEVSGDRNPIHLHSLTAKPFGFGAAIAHGMWAKARCLAALEARVGDAWVASVEFRSPLRIPGRVRFRVARDRAGFGFALEPRGEGRPHLTGSIAPAGA